MTEAGGSGATRRGPGRVTAAAAGLVVVLALGAVLWPRAETHLEAPSLLVFDPSGDDTRVAGVYGHLQEHLAAASGRELGLIVVRDLAAYGRELARTPAFVLAPDGLALAAGPGEYLPVASVRRPAPRNLRPSGAAIFRRGRSEGGQSSSGGSSKRLMNLSTNIDSVRSTAGRRSSFWVRNCSRLATSFAATCATKSQLPITWKQDSTSSSFLICATN